MIDRYTTQHQGFLMVECMVALAILAIAALALAQFQGMLHGQHAHTVHRARALVYAHDLLERGIATGFPDQPYERDGIQITWQTRPLDLPHNPVLVEVTTQWRVGASSGLQSCKLSTVLAKNTVRSSA